MKTLLKTQIALVFASMLFVTTACAQSKSIKGNGKLTKVTRNTEHYNTIKCVGTMDFILVSGNEGNITIEGEENLLEYIVTEVNGDVLKVKVKQGKNIKPSKNKTIKITIPFKDINNVSLSGSGDLWNTDLINAAKLNVALTGSGDIVLHIKTLSVKGTISGSGDLTLKGNTNNLEAKVTGSGDFHGFDLQAKNTEVSVTGAGDAKVVCSQKLKAKVTGSGDIEYKGSPTTKNTKIVGSGSITKY